MHVARRMRNSANRNAAFVIRAFALSAKRYYTVPYRDEVCDMGERGEYGVVGKPVVRDARATAPSVRHFNMFIAARIDCGFHRAFATHRYGDGL